MYKDGTAITDHAASVHAPGGNGDTVVTLTGVEPLAVNDYVQVYITCTSGTGTISFDHANFNIAAVQGALDKQEYRGILEHSGILGHSVTQVLRESLA